MPRTRTVRNSEDDGDSYIPPPIEIGAPPPPAPPKPPPKPGKPRKSRAKPKPQPFVPFVPVEAIAPVEPPEPVPEPPPLPPVPPPPPGPPPFTSSDARLLKAVLSELYERSIESLRLYKALPKLEAFHATNVHTRLMIGSNRAGKSLVSAVEVARAVTAQDPYDKYPKQNGVAFLFGNDEAHLGSVMYAKLFRAGAFQIIKDEITREWRVFDQIKDKARKKEAKPAPPLIPRRFIEGKIVWTNAGARIPKLIRLRNGWELYFFSSEGNLPRGQDIDLWWVDEEVERKNLMEEVYARCPDRAGIGFWSCTPQSSTEQLYELHDRAQQQQAAAKEDPTYRPTVYEFFAKLADNPFISDEEKQKFYDSLGEEGRRVRYEGEFALSRFTVYAEFALGIHSWDEKAKPITERWPRWLIIDPGRQRCAILFAAIAPPEVKPKGAMVLYDELIIKDCTARDMARAVAAKSRGIIYEGGVIDKRAGRAHEMGFGRTIKDWYEIALHKEGVEFRGGGRPSLAWSCDDIDAGVERVKDMLRVRPNGQPGLFICADRLRQWRHEIELYRNAADPKTKMPTDKPVQKGCDLMDCTRYIALHDPEWVEPERPARHRSAVLARLKKKREKDGQDAVIRLSSGGAG